MKKTPMFLLSALALGISCMAATADDEKPKGPRPEGAGGPGGPGGERRPAPPLVAALDANHDGVIDATEMANAAAALKTLDKNGDGKLTMDEVRPAGGPGGPGGPGPRDGERGRKGPRDGEGKKGGKPDEAK